MTEHVGDWRWHLERAEDLLGLRVSHTRQEMAAGTLAQAHIMLADLYLREQEKIG